MINKTDTIVAQCTPQGIGAIATIRLSGGNVRSLLKPFSKFFSNRCITEVKSHTIEYGMFVDEKGEVVDYVLFLIMDGPRSFTGEHIIEITPHNNQFIIDKIISLCCASGARIAERGEFARRAYLNKKIDLLQAESIVDIVHAQSEHSLKASMEQFSGSLSSAMKDIEDDLFTISAWCQATFEFLEEDRNFTNDILQRINNLLEKVDTMIIQHDMQKYIREGIRIALVGSVNAGKSSLFNLLVKQDRAIVTSLPGTTRDSIECGFYRNGFYITCIDTAGIRSSNNLVEKLGIERSYQEAEKADILLMIVDSSRSMTKDEKDFYKNLSQKYNNKLCIIHSKADLPQVNTTPIKHENEVFLSSHNKTGINTLWQLIDKKIASFASNAKASSYLINKRHVHLLQTTKHALIDMKKYLSSQSVHYEILYIKIRDALTGITSMTGKSIDEASLDKVFKSFCVGK